VPFHPYLFFGGNCREAFTRYQEVFGGELVLLTMRDMADGEAVPPGQAELIMHAALKSDGLLLMGSDDPSTDGFGPVQGMMVNFSTADVAEAGRVFDALAVDGSITLAIAATPWSPAFGMCTDRFGTPWMVGADAPAA
jgi:PhnB protein